MEHLNNEFEGKLSLGIEIFKNSYNKRFLHDLVSSQLDMDRLDYLKRDSFFTGVTEGGIGSDRIIKMLRVVNDELAVEEKGIYSVEQFIVARRIMYWQVYLHKTVIASEIMMRKAVQRAKDESKKQGIFVTPALAYFFDNEDKLNNINKIDDFSLETFAKLDDSDIIVSMKEWMNHSDKVLSIISKSLINRNLFKVEISRNEFDPDLIESLRIQVAEKYSLTDKDVKDLVFSEKIKNKAYSIEEDVKINILLKSGKLSDIAKASDLDNIRALSKTVEKYFLCYPKEPDYRR